MLEYQDYRDVYGPLTAMQYWTKWWDENNPTGEGSTPLGVEYQWVRITDNRGKALGTFMFKLTDGEPVEMFLAPVRKGMPPNPYLLFLVSDMFSWVADDHKPIYDRVLSLPKSAQEWRDYYAKKESPRTPPSLEGLPNDWPVDWRYSDPEWLEYWAWVDQKEAEMRPRGDMRVIDLDDNRFRGSATGWSEANRHGGFRPITGIVPVPRVGGDHGMRFQAGKDSFVVKLSKLAPVLWKFRRAGVQHVSVGLLREALRRDADQH